MTEEQVGCKHTEQAAESDDVTGGGTRIQRHSLRFEEVYFHWKCQSFPALIIIEKDACE